ncbi:chorismate mutase [Ammoniphilus sp. 3BR4]|uniref:chorismate mutase n=1 Tax=Ammoniphilus sp. 3BR4 TaxID=3158265 RepID=UPI003467B5A3
MEDLTNLREQLDKINIQLLEILNERGKIVQKIGEKKLELGRTEAYDPKREEEIFEYLFKGNTGPYDNEMIKNIFKQVFDESSKLQEKLLKK